MEGQLTFNQWVEMKEDIRRRLQETADNFVFLGYRMKQIRDTKAYEQDGCSSITEWAQKEYGLEKTAVSRFIAINDKFSEDGNSLVMKKEYCGLGSSKLAEMLTLSEAECSLISQKTSVKEIRDLKQFNRQEPPKVVEGDNTIHSYTPLQKCIIDYFSDVNRRPMLDAVMNILWIDGSEQIRFACHEMNPTEYGTHKKGIVYLFMYDYETGVKYKTLGSQDIIEMNWNDFLKLVFGIYMAYSSKEDYWCNYYGPIPEIIPKEKVAEEKKIEITKKTVTFSKNAELRPSQLKDEDTDNDDDTEDDLEENSEDEEEEEAESTESEQEDITEPNEVSEAAGLDLENLETVIGIDYSSEESKTAYMDPPEKVECEVVLDIQEIQVDEPIEDSEDTCVEVMDLEDLHEWVFKKDNVDTEMTHLISYIQEAMKQYDSVVITGKVRGK